MRKNNMSVQLMGMGPNIDAMEQLKQKYERQKEEFVIQEADLGYKQEQILYLLWNKRYLEGISYNWSYHELKSLAYSYEITQGNWEEMQKCYFYGLKVIDDLITKWNQLLFLSKTSNEDEEKYSKIYSFIERNKTPLCRVYVTKKVRNRSACKNCKLERK